ncbi:hypothetical protein IK110_04485 [Candidatus Saccharibacteria bacterium]|nr:hypothetical protein [Candidatus Saccharibacteria bacterium]
MIYSDPMPGENFENAESEQAKAERDAIANGESFNPYSDDGFASLGGEVPFSGEEDATEEPELTAGESADAGKMDDNEFSDSEKTVVGKVISSDFKNGVATDLEGLKSTIEGDYKTDTTKDILNDQAALGAAENAIANAGVNEEDARTDNGNAVERGSQPKDSASVAGELAIATDSMVDDFVEKAKTGNEDALTDSSKIEEDLIMTQRAIDSIDTAVATNGNEEEAMLAMNLKEQAQKMKDDAEEQFNEAKDKLDSMDEEQLADAQEAEKKAEENGTSFDDELQKLEETRKKLEEEERNMQANIQNDISAGIFG